MVGEEGLVVLLVVFVFWIELVSSSKRYGERIGNLNSWEEVFCKIGEII